MDEVNQRRASSNGNQLSLKNHLEGMISLILTWKPTNSYGAFISSGYFLAMVEIPWVSDQVKPIGLMMIKKYR